MLVRRWAILPRPLTCPLAKVGHIVMCICRLHNFCINVKDNEALRSYKKDAVFAVRFMDTLRNHVDNCISNNATLLHLELGRLDNLLHGGSHFNDAPHNRIPVVECCLMDD